MKEGDKVQVWSETEKKCLGWGTIIQIAKRISDKEKIPLIQLEESRTTIWGDQCYWIEEKKAIEIGVRLFHDIYREPRR